MIKGHLQSKPSPSPPSHTRQFSHYILFSAIYLPARRSNQSILKEISPEYSLEGLMLKLKLQCSGHLMRRMDSLEKTLMLGKIEGGREITEDEIGWMASPTRWTRV